jgi:hypothetical protein
MSVDSVLKPRRLALIVGAGLLLWQQLPLLRSDALLQRDDLSFLAPLRPLGSLGAYLHALATQPDILDVQPLRDVSYLFNLWLLGRTGHGFFHAFNVLLGWLCLYWVLRLYSLVSARAATFDSVLLSVLFVSHSTLAVSLSWVGARKHLLAGCFVLMATCLVLELKLQKLSKPRALLTYAGYVFSIFSHPIHLLWPLWGGALLRKEVLRLRWVQGVALLFAVTLGVAAFLNHAHYTGPSYATKPKLGFEYNDAGLLAQWARAFLNVFLPGPRPTLYNPHTFETWQNALILLASVATLVMACWKVRPLRSVAALGLLPMLLMFSQPTNIFLADTYLFLPATCWVLAALVALPREAPWRNLGRALLLALALAHAAFSHDIVASYQSDFELWKYAHSHERYFQTEVRFAGQLLNVGDAKSASDVLLSSADARNDSQYPLALARSIYEHPSLRWEEKLAVLLREDFRNDWFLYYRALVALNSQALPQARKDAQLLMQLPSYKGSVPAAEARRLLDFVSQPDAPTPGRGGRRPTACPGFDLPRPPPFRRPETVFRPREIPAYAPVVVPRLFASDARRAASRERLSTRRRSAVPRACRAPDECG